MTKRKPESLTFEEASAVVLSHYPNVLMGGGEETADDAAKRAVAAHSFALANRVTSSTANDVVWLWASILFAAVALAIGAWCIWKGHYVTGGACVTGAGAFFAAGRRVAA